MEPTQVTHAFLLRHTLPPREEPPSPDADRLVLAEVAQHIREDIATTDGGRIDVLLAVTPGIHRGACYSLCSEAIWEQLTFYDRDSWAGGVDWARQLALQLMLQDANLLDGIWESLGSYYPMQSEIVTKVGIALTGHIQQTLLHLPATKAENLSAYARVSSLYTRLLETMGTDAFPFSPLGGVRTNRAIDLSTFTRGDHEVIALAHVSGLPQLERRGGLSVMPRSPTE